MSTAPSKRGPSSQTVRINAVRVALSGETTEGGRDTPLRPAPPLLTGETRATLTVMTGLDAGRVITLEVNSMTVGRGPDADLTFEDSALSRQHARVTRTPTGFRIEDLASTNGTFVNARRVRSAALSSGEHIQLGPNLLLRFDFYDEQDESLQRRLFESAMRDPLTGAYNRQHLAGRLAAEVAHARRTGRDLSLIMIDVDHFKEFNDDFGHVSGDRILRGVTKQIARIVRTEDVFARYGGDEFVVLARDADLAEATRLAERLRAAVSSAPIRQAELRHAEARHGGPGEPAFSVTVSLGVVSLDELTHGGPRELLTRADARLYGAKLGGRNRVCNSD